MDEKICFFVSPIGDDNSEERKNSDTVLKYFLDPVCKELGYKVIRSDQESIVEKIDDAVIKHLINDELVICDLTGYNPNVFYEFGYRRAINLPLVPMITKGQSIPMDTSSLRTIHYVTNDLNQQESIKSKLKESITAFEADNTKQENPQNNTFNVPSALSQSLLSIQDSLDELKSLMKNRNKDEIDLISRQVAKYAQPKTSENADMVKALLPSLLENPEGFQQLLNFVDKNNL